MRSSGGKGGFGGKRGVYSNQIKTYKPHSLPISMKEVRFQLEDWEYEELLKKKEGRLSWKDLMLLNIKDKKEEVQKKN